MECESTDRFERITMSFLCSMSSFVFSMTMTISALNVGVAGSSNVEESLRSFRVHGAKPPNR